MKSVTKKLVLLVLSLGLGFWLVEAALRQVFVDCPYDLPLFEPRLEGPSYRLRPEVRFQTRMETRRVVIEADPWGNVGRLAVAPERPPGLVRVGILGDSFAFGLWANSHCEAMVGVAAAETAAAGIEWVNFAVPGYGYADMRLRLEQEALRWKPDWIILCSFNGNDFRETYLGPNQTLVEDGFALPNEILAFERIPEALRPPVRRHPAAPRRFSRLGQLRRRIRTLNVLFHTIHSLRRSRDAAFNQGGSNLDYLDPSPFFTAYSFWSRTDCHPAQAQAIEAALAELQLIANICAAHGIRLAVLSIPYREQVYTRQMQGPGYDLRHPQLYIEQFCAARGIPYVDLLPSFRAAVAADSRALYCQHDPHFNDAGHALAGKLLATFVQSLTVALWDD